MNENKDLVVRNDGETTEITDISDNESLGSVCAGIIAEIATDGSVNPELRLEAAKMGLELEKHRQNLAYQSYENDKEREFKATEGDKDRVERTQVRHEEAEQLKSEMESLERENESERQFQSDENDKERKHEEKMAVHHGKTEVIKSLIKKPISIIIIVAIIAGGIWCIFHFTKHAVQDVVFNMLVPPKSSDDIVKMNYKEAEKAFLERGFTNIELIPVYDGTTGLFDTGFLWGNDKTVKSVTINGLAEFKASDQFNADDKVTIHYHVDSDKDPAKQ